MARRRRGNYTKADHGRRRRRRSRATAAEGSGSGDEDDEEYVVGEDEDGEDEEEEFVASEQEESEEEYKFDESSSEDDDEDEDLGEDDEDGDYSMPRPMGRKRRGASKPAGKKRGRKARVFSEEEDEMVLPLPLPLPTPAWRGRRGRKPRVSVEEEVEEIVRQPRTGMDGPKRRMRKFMVSDDDDEDLVAPPTKAAAEELGRSRRKRSGDSGCVDQDEDETEVEKGGEETEDESDEDEDFAPDEEDFDEEEELILMPRRHQRADLELGRRKRKVRARSRGRKRRRARSEDEDEEFIDDSLDGFVKNRKKKKNVRNKRRNIISKAGSEEEEEISEHNLVTSDDDDFMQEDQVALAEERKRISNMGKTRRKRFVVGSSESSSDEGVAELVDVGVLGQPKPKRIFAGRKGQEKGKEKENDESRKQICGICLSDEQKSTTRGGLNCCAHYFCFACIMEWSKVESRCPVCKRRFETVTKSSISDSGFGTRKSVIRVQKRDQVYQPSEEEIRRMLDPYENVVCMECQEGRDDNLMLLCDICDSSAHTYCVGLGREVPEGNWYCECCRSVSSMLSYPQSQENLVDQGTSSNNMLHNDNGPTEVIASRHSTTETQRSVCLPDLNASPRLDEDYVAMSQTHGGGAFTVSNRRAIRNRIRILLSNGRSRSGTDVPRRNLISDITASVPERAGPNLHELEELNYSNQESFVPHHQQTVRTGFQSSANLVPCSYNEGSSFCQVEDARTKCNPW